MFLTRVPQPLLWGMVAWTLVTFGIGWYAMQGTTRGHADHGNRPVATLPSVAALVTPTVVKEAARSSTGAATRSASPRSGEGTARADVGTPAATRTARATGTPRIPGTTVNGTPVAGVRTPTATGSVGVPPEVATATSTAVPTWTPTAHPKTATAVPATATPAPYPVPRYAQSAGVEGGAAGAGGRSTAVLRDAAHAPNKGVIVLDPGHGRGDPGAVHHLPDGTPDVLEAEVNLRNAQLIRDRLLALGYDVYLTRDGAGRGPDGPLVQQFISSDLIWRTQLAAAVDADLFLALHGNGASVTSISGPETWYCGVHEQGSANARFAAMIQQAMMDALREYGYFPPNRGIMEDAERHHGDFCQFVVVRETKMPAALLEFLFLSNDNDARVLADGRSQEILAVHVADAIDRFMTGRP